MWSAPDSAKEVPPVPAKVAFGDAWAPGGLLWHSQSLTVLQKVCRFPSLVSQHSEHKSYKNNVVCSCEFEVIQPLQICNGAWCPQIRPLGSPMPFPPL